jgi:hypothetical protein
MTPKKRRVMARPLQEPSRKPEAGRRVTPLVAGLIVLVVGLVAIFIFLPRLFGGPVATGTPPVAGLPTPPPLTPPPGGSVAVPTQVGPTDGATPPVATPGVPTGNQGLVVDWHQVPDPGLGVVIGVTGAASANGRLVVIGDSTEDFVPAIWWSDNGNTWQLAQWPDSGNSALALTGVTAGGPGFVAVGSDYESEDAINAVTYTSTDGVSWQRGDDPDLAGQSAFLIGAAGTNVVAFADSGAVFKSSDGLSWDPVLDASAVEVGDGLLDVAGYNGSLWAFSTAPGATEEESGPLDVWRTDDGISWTRLGTVPDSLGALDARTAVGPKGLVLVADIDNADSFAWHGWQSADGANWQPATNTPAEITDVLSDETGFIAVGYYNLAGGCAVDETENVGVTWTSVDGLTWRQMSQEGWVGREVDVLGLIGRTLVGVGIDWNLLYAEEGGNSGLVWTADLPASAQDDLPPPSPAPEPTAPPDC